MDTPILSAVVWHTFIFLWKLQLSNQTFTGRQRKVGCDSPTKSWSEWCKAARAKSWWPEFLALLVSPSIMYHHATYPQNPQRKTLRPANSTPLVNSLPVPMAFHDSVLAALASHFTRGRLASIRGSHHSHSKSRRSTVNDHQMLSTVECNINLKGASGQEVRRSPVGQGVPSNPSKSFNETPTTTHCVFEISTNSSSVMKCESQQSFCTWNCLCHTCSGAPHKRQKVGPLPSRVHQQQLKGARLDAHVSELKWRYGSACHVLRHGWPEWNFRPLGRKKSHKNSERE